RYERELGNDLGNLLSRTTAMIDRYRGGRLPTAPDATSPIDLDRLRDEVAARLDRVDLTRALDEIWNEVRALNRFVEQRRPWELARDEANAAELDTVLYALADGLRGLAVALAGHVPETAERILDALRQPHELGWDRVAGGLTVAADGI